jgi:hypothetical protein
VSSSGQEVLKSFDLLPEIEKRQVASEIIRRAFSLNREITDEAQLEALYASFAKEDLDLAEEGIEDYGRGLTAEDVQ